MFNKLSYILYNRKCTPMKVKKKPKILATYIMKNNVELKNINIKDTILYDIQREREFKK